jgi:hypothetical protein
MVASCCTYMAWGIVPPCASVVVLVPFVWAHVQAGVGLLVRGGDFSCEEETCLARQRLVVRGGDLSCKTETCRADSSSGKLVGDAANWPKTRRLASVGFDQGHFSSLS